MHLRKIHLVGIVGLYLFYSSLNAEENIIGLKMPYPEEGVLLGQGWNSIEQKGAPGICVEIDEHGLESNSFTTNARQLITKHSLFKDSAFSVSASYANGGFSASGSVEKKKSFKFNSDKFYFHLSFVSNHAGTFALPKGTSPDGSDTRLFSEFSKNSDKASEIFQTRVANHISENKIYSSGIFTLSEKAQKYITDKEFDEFYEKCGSGFVSTIYRGAKLDFVISSASDSVEKNESLAASMKASGFGGSVSGAYSNSKKEVNSEEEIKTEVFQEGGIPVGPPKTIDEIKQIYENIDSLLVDPRAYLVNVTPYSSFIDENLKFDSIHRSLVFLSEYNLASRSVLDTANEIYQQLLSVSLGQEESSDYSSVLVEAISSGRSAEDYMKELIEEISIHVEFIELIIRQCRRSPEKCSNINNLISEVSSNLNISEYVQYQKLKSTLTESSYARDYFRIIANYAANNVISLGDAQDRKDYIEKLDSITLVNGQTLKEFLLDDEFNARIFSQHVLLPSYTGVLPKPPEVNESEQARAQEIDNAGKERSLMRSVHRALGLHEVYPDDIKMQIDEDFDRINLTSDIHVDRIANISSILEEYDGIASFEQMDERFYQKMYSLLARLPFPDVQFPLGVISTKSSSSSKTSDTSNSYVTTKTTTKVAVPSPLQTSILENPQVVYKASLLKYRLLPVWVEYCSGSMTNVMCPTLTTLESYGNIEIDEERIKNNLADTLSYKVITVTEKEEWKDHCDWRGRTNQCPR